MSWAPDSWRRFEARQQPHYEDRSALAAALDFLSISPPLVTLEEVGALTRRLAEAAAGGAFVVQGGDCAERLDRPDDRSETATLALLDDMAATFTARTGIPAVAIGRVGGQFAKPRSQDPEARDGRSLPAWRGDIVNGQAFDPVARRPDPSRLHRAYRAAAATHRRLRARARADARIWTSHEALLLPYEQALVRAQGDRTWAGSGHFLWIGDRTRFEGSAHVEFVRGLANPIGIKCGPTLDAATLLRLLEQIDPDRVPGRTTLIVRHGAGRVATMLPTLIEAIRREGRQVLWCCDPMHGNTSRSPDGRKGRSMAAIRAEIRDFLRVARAEGVIPAGLHLEMTGEEVVECQRDESDADRPLPSCDPRLNRSQAMELARFVASGTGEETSAKNAAFA